jgi:hypothetical protein
MAAGPAQGGTGPALIFISRDLPREADPALRLLQSWAPWSLAFKFIRQLQKPRLCYTSRDAQQTPSLLWGGISALHRCRLLGRRKIAICCCRFWSVCGGAFTLWCCGADGARCRPLRGLRFGVWQLTPGLTSGAAICRPLRDLGLALKHGCGCLILVAFCATEPALSLSKGPGLSGASRMNSHLARASSPASVFADETWAVSDCAACPAGVGGAM